MCMNGNCGRCGAACKAPEPKLGVMKDGPAGPRTGVGDGLDVAKKNVAEAAKKARAKRY